MICGKFTSLVQNSGEKKMLLSGAIKKKNSGIMSSNLKNAT